MLYSGRQPQLSPLYTIVSRAGEDLIRFWPEQFQAQYGALRDVVKESFERYLQCGILEHGCAGCALAHCTYPECNHSELIPLSRKLRKSLATTNMIEGLIDKIRAKLHRVRNGRSNKKLGLRWTAAAIRLHQKSFKRLRGSSQQTEKLIKALQNFALKKLAA